MLDSSIDLKVLNFFDLAFNVNKISSKINLLNKKYLLQSFSKLLNEEEFAKVYMGWKDEGIFFIFDIDINFSNSVSDYRKGDSIEIFIDTRSLKTKGYLTKFCHHFVFFAQEIDGYKGMEVTRFRFDDMHNLTEAKNLKVESIIKPNSSIIQIEIPKDSLYGFAPREISYFSFTYRINRLDAPAMHFSLSSLEHVIEKSPHLWAKVNMLES
jgi:hypothetical protein